MVYGNGMMFKGLFALALLTAAAAEDTPEMHLGKGYDALRQDRYDVAASEFRAALRLDPKLVMRARFPLAVALFELKESAEARREFEAVRRDIGDHPSVAYYLGRLDIQDQNFESAIRNLNTAVAKPPFPDTAYYLGFACMKQGDLTASERWLKQAAQINPRDSLAPYQLGLVYRKEGREEDANKAFALSGEIRQRDADESTLRTECAQKLDHASREEAHALCQRLYDPDNAEKLAALGAIYGQHGDLEAALIPLRRAAELAPQTPQMQYNLAWTYYQMGRFEEARVPLAGAVERWPDLFPLNALYGAVLWKLGEALPAYEALNRAHQLNQQDPATTEMLYRTSLELARSSQAARRYSDSIRYLQGAAKLRPDAAEPHRALAEIYNATGHPSEASAEQQQADRLNAAR
jgi:tetratricopeptide (TPR) repeat protein